MLILFDHGTPRGLVRVFPEHTVRTALAQGWDQLSNDSAYRRGRSRFQFVAHYRSADTLSAEPEGPHDFYRCSDRTTKWSWVSKWSWVRLQFDLIATAVNAATAGSYIEVEIPFT